MPSYRIVIPVLNEEDILKKRNVQNFLLANARKILVVDGGSEDNTLKLLGKVKELELIKTSSHSIAHSISKACSVVKDKYILILPIDCDISKSSLGRLEAHLEKGDVVWGGFYKAYDESNFFTRVYLFLQNKIRSFYFKNLVWTNGIFCKREVLLSNLEETSFLEDVLLVDKLKRIEKPLLLEGPVIASFRRYEGKLFSRIFVNLKIMFLFRFRNKSIDELKRIYLS